jgi:hypothetical protein
MAWRESCCVIELMAKVIGDVSFARSFESDVFQSAGGC